MDTKELRILREENVRLRRTIELLKGLIPKKTVKKGRYE